VFHPLFLNVFLIVSHTFRGPPMKTLTLHFFPQKM
jgi:hypothetical protein